MVETFQKWLNITWKFGKKSKVLDREKKSK